VYFLFLTFDFYNIPGIGSITRILSILPMGFCLIERIYNDRNIKIELNRITILLIMFLVSAFVSTVLSISMSYSLSPFLTLLSNTIMVILLGSTRIYTEEEIGFLKKCLVGCGWLTAILMAIFSDFSISRMIFSIGDSKQDPNYLCGYMLYAFSFHLCQIIDYKRYMHIVFCSVFIVLVFLSGSRGALLSYVAAVIVGVLFSNSLENSKKRNTIGAIIIIVVGVFLIYRFILPHINSSIMERYTISYIKEYGTVGRIDIWKYLLAKYHSTGILRHLIGFGYGTTIIINNMVHMGGHVAHNLYIENLVCSGLLGLFIQLLLHFTCLKTSAKIKYNVALCTFFAFITMCMSLSLTSYKPIWALIIMIMICDRRNKYDIQNN